MDQINTDKLICAALWALILRWTGLALRHLLLRSRLAICCRRGRWDDAGPGLANGLLISGHGLGIRYRRLAGRRCGDGWRGCGEHERCGVIADDTGLTADGHLHAGAEGITGLAGDAEDFVGGILIIRIHGDALIGSFFLHHGHAVAATDGRNPKQDEVFKRIDRWPGFRRWWLRGEW